METETLGAILLGSVILSGFLKALSVAGLYLVVGPGRGEAIVRKAANFWGVADFAAALVLISQAAAGALPGKISFGDALGIEAELIFRTDVKSLAALAFSLFILGLVGRLSAFYLHKDHHFYKFFTLFFIFQTATALLVLSETFVSFFVGWELLGISSVLLISLYEERSEVVKNSLRILLLYKLSDVLLFAAFALANQSGGAIRLSELGHLQDSVGGVCILLVSLALLIKTGGFPFVWLPRAMEGPTPSSAVFYGAIATHVPVGLFAMLWAKGPFPEWVQLVLIAIATIVMGLAMIYSRVEANAKNALAYATVQNLMLIVIEGLLGFSWLAIGHALLHCLYRLAQFMRAPSQLYEHHRSQGFAGRSEPRRRIYESIFPSRVEATLYRWSLHEFYIFPRLVRTLDNLIGISCDLYRRQLIMIVVANCIGIFGLAALEWAGSGLEYQSQVFLLAPAWAFALIALLSDASGPGHLRIVALAVTSLLAAILTFDEWLSLWNYGLIQAGIAYGMRIAIRSAHRGEDGDRHSARRSRLRFAFALLIGGVPGPGTYYLFERAIHLALSVDVPFAIGAFTVLSLITTGVVRNHSLRGIVSRNRPGKNDGAVGIELRSEFGSSARPTRAKPGVATGLRA